ncbi:hypothetical protein MTO96_030973 [Rhipicephalus appendiculatus]
MRRFLECVVQPEAPTASPVLPRRAGSRAQQAARNCMHMQRAKDVIRHNAHQATLPSPPPRPSLIAHFSLTIAHMRGSPWSHTLECSRPGTPQPWYTLAASPEHKPLVGVLHLT